MWWLVSIALAEDPVHPSVREEPQPDGSVRIVPDRTVPPDLTRATQVLLEFGEVSLYDLTLYFADALRKNILLADEADLKSRKLRLVGHEAMTTAEAWEAYRSALRMYGYTTSEAGEVVTIVKTSQAPQGPVPVGTGAPAGIAEGFVTRILPVRNGVAAELVAVVRPLLSPEAQLTAYAPANTLIVTDAAGNVRKVSELVEILDVAAPETTLATLQLHHATADEVKQTIEALYPPAEPSADKPTRERPRKGAPAGSAPVDAAGERRRHVSKVLADARTNRLIVLANPDGHAAVAALVADLDADVDATQRQRLHVIHLKYAIAEEVAAVVTQLDAPTRGAPKPPRPADGKVEPSASFEGEARVAADPSTNALAVVADPDEFASIAELVAALDVERMQVFVDAVFVELSDTDGAEIALGAHTLPSADSPGMLSTQLDPTQQLTSFRVSPDLLSGLAAGVFGPVVEIATAEGVLEVPTFGIALRALQAHSDVHVMGNPALLVLDHEEATLSVGRKIPFQTATQLSTLGVPIQTFERVDVAMTLVVTPHVNDADLVTLELELDVDEVEGSTAESALAGGPVTNSRTLESRVMVADGQTVVLAGVASTKEQSAESKVPILGDIPLIGALFRGRTTSQVRTNLMVFLTPHVVERPSDLLAIRRIKEAQRAEFVRRFQGRATEEWLVELEQLLDDASDPAADAE
ncbi:MAG: type II secretion system secretin GspD [Myxococcota bacterium]